MNNTELSFMVCNHLIVRTDHGHSSHPDYKQISVCECNANKCKNRGVCIEARMKNTWTRPSSKSKLKKEAESD